MQVASTEDSQIQKVLMDAFAEGLVTTMNFGQARRIIVAWAWSSRKTPAKSDYTVNQLQHDIAETTRVKTTFVREAKSKENRFMTLLTGINSLFQDPTLVELL